MKIMMVKPDTVQQSPTISLGLPDGWVGDVPDAEGHRLVKKKSAVRIDPPAEKGLKDDGKKTDGQKPDGQ